MMARDEKKRIVVDAHMAAVIKGMLKRGDRQHDIAAWFGINGGRVAEVSLGKRFPEVPAATENLPPRGPQLAGLTAQNMLARLETARGALRIALEEVDQAISELDAEAGLSHSDGGRPE